MKDKKILNYIKTNYKFLIFILILIGINVLSFNRLCIEFPSTFIQRYLKLVFLAFNFLEIGLFIIAKIMLKKNMPIEKIFLSIIIPLGLCYMLFIPIGRVPDEQNHFLRAYDISQGHLISSKDKFGNGGNKFRENISDYFRSKTSNKHMMYKDVYINLKTKQKYNNKFIKFENTSLYSFVCYIPQVIGILISKLFSLPIVMSMYFGRLTNFIMWIILIYYSIKIIPYKKTSLLVISFMPMMLQEAISLSADALTNAMSIFLLSYVLYLKHNNEKITKKDWIILIISTITISMCKIVYLPICLVLFLLPNSKFKSKKDKYLKIFLLAVFVILINIVWLVISSTYLIEFNEGVNSSEQLKFILSNPLIYTKYLFNTIYENISFYVYSMIGFALCYLDVNLSYLFIFIYLIMIIIVFTSDNNEKIELNEKILLLFISFCVVMLIFLSLYIQWTPVGNEIINGIQGRYFIPILLPLTILCNNNLIKINKSINKNFLLIIFDIIILINIYSLIVLFFNHI